MTATKQLLASDYDKTFFYKANPQALPENLAAVEQWQKAGNLFAISTGRDAASMLYEQTHKGVQFDYLVALNGSFIIDGNKEVIFKQALPHSIAQSLVSDIREEFNDELIVSNGFNGCNFTNRQLSQSDPAAAEIFHRNSQIYTRTIEQALEHEVYLVGCLAEDQDKAQAIRTRILEKHEDDVEVFINLNYINIVPKGISKASGIEFIMKHAQLEHTQVSVIGDDFNDIPMIQAFRGFAVPNATPALVEYAEGTVETVAELIHSLSK
ncbi:HAD-IIB family hydrolase [Vibrio maerlii]|uniref:HAD-IIB family hydrolase n=1 Tax=Vibrio maerlii TaxID=2231648 RepID=UPI0013E0C169|nr:HAD family hydrolase [Vibrio maerlii]